MAAHLTIRKRMQLIQGKVRPCCFVQAKFDPEVQRVLEEHFINEPLFKRSSYSVSWPKGAIEPPAALMPALSAFLKNDACPEITVKTMLNGQLHQGSNVWEMLCFEVIAKLSFDNMLELGRAVTELDRELTFHGSATAAEIAAFTADAAADARTLATPDLSAQELAA